PYCVRETTSDALEIGKHAVAPFVVKASKCSGKEMIINHGARSPSGLCPTTGTLPIQSAPMPLRSRAIARQLWGGERGRPVLGRGDRPQGATAKGRAPGQALECRLLR